MYSLFVIATLNDAHSYRHVSPFSSLLRREEFLAMTKSTPMPPNKANL